MAISEATGGFYVRTNLFSRTAVQRVADALSGHYILFVEKPEGKPGRHEVAVRLIRGKGTVYARTAYAD